MADFARNVVSLNPFKPRYMMKTAFEVMLQAVDAWKKISPVAGDGLQWQEFHNKLQAFYLFEYVDSVLGLSPDSNPDLQEMLLKTGSLGPFLSVWATEGLGHYYSYVLTSASLARGATYPCGLLSHDQKNLPQASIIPLHTGMGLALAEAVLAQGGEAGTLAENFIQLCRSNSRPEYWRAAVEALGLVVRNLYPSLIMPLDQHFSAMSEELLGYFWHGVGRGIYFLPANSMPWWSVLSNGFDSCIQETPHELGRRNVVAGLAWAMTLVNLRHPEIIAAFLQQNGAKLADNDAFSNGVFSSLVVWLESAPDDSDVRSFCNYKPSHAQSSLLRLWDKQIRQPCSQAFRYRETRKDTALDEIFRYQPYSSNL